LSAKPVATKPALSITVHDSFPPKSRTIKFSQFLNLPCSPSFSKLITDAENLIFQNREVSLDNIPNAFQLYSQIIMHNNIAETTDFSPRHFGILELRVG
jgi:hypothetical protein